MGRALRPMPSAPTVVLTCQVLEDLLARRLVRTDARIIVMDYGLHIRPSAMTPALQAQLDALPEPSLVLLGYGLCGGGLEGLQAGPHTLIIPRTHDCIAILLGSRAAYQDAFRDHPGTYYLTKGWLESGSHPLAEYDAFCLQYGEETAGRLLDTMYRHYTRICFIAVEPGDLAVSGPRAREVGNFCAERWGMVYDERVGTDTLVQALVEAPQNPQSVGEDLLVVPPGGTVTADQFRA